MLMGADTLLDSREHWTRESVPVSDHLPLLTADAQAVYQVLLGNEFGDHVRLEPERIRFSAVEHAVLAAAPPV